VDSDQIWLKMSYEYNKIGWGVPTTRTVVLLFQLFLLLVKI